MVSQPCTSPPRMGIRKSWGVFWRRPTGLKALKFVFLFCFGGFLSCFFLWGIAIRSRFDALFGCRVVMFVIFNGSRSKRGLWRFRGLGKMCVLLCFLCFLVVLSVLMVVVCGCVVMVNQSWSISDYSAMGLRAFLFIAVSWVFDISKCFVKFIARCCGFYLIGIP